MTADASDLPKYARVAMAVRGQIADGTLRPGQPAPSGAALSRVTGYSTLTCRRALRLLIAEGVLSPGPSRNARPRVAGAAAPPGERDLAGAGEALSASLAARRRSRGLTQPALAARAGVSVTTVGHAETGRLWQSRRFWEEADAALDAGGALLTLHDAYRAAAVAQQAGRARPPDAPGPAAAWPVPPGGGGQAGDTSPAPGGAALPGHQARVQEAAAPAGPASVTIVWGNGTTTTVRPPGSPAAMSKPRP
jgi:hypothetical protein